MKKVGAKKRVGGTSERPTSAPVNNPGHHQVLLHIELTELGVGRETDKVHSLVLQGLWCFDWVHVLAPQLS